MSNLSWLWLTCMTCLRGFGIPVFADAFVSSTGEESPDEYIVFQIMLSKPVQYADDKETVREHYIQVTYFNRAGFDNMRNIIEHMIGAGFMNGTNRGLPYEPSTRYYSMAMDFTYVQNKIG
jgi:hypothetical protein